MTHALPDPQVIRSRIKDCREELTALKKLLRLSEQAAKADEARRRRERREASHAS
jgi:hypothetical protein